MSDTITADLVDLDLSADTKEAAARALAERMVTLGRVTDLKGFLADVAAREAQMPTGLDGGIGIPHCRSAHVTEPTLAFGRSGAGIDFGAPDGPADLIFLIAAPAGADDAHLTLLSALARRLMNTEFTDALRAATDAEHAAALIRGEETAPEGSAPEDAAPEGSAPEDAASEGGAPEGRASEAASAGGASADAAPEGGASEDAASQGAGPEGTAPEGADSAPDDSVAAPAAASAGAATGPPAHDGDRPHRIVAV
ncbi:PTS sugar transporter subunit IIA, partial [Streptomyces griseoincarnatus]